MGLVLGIVVIGAGTFLLFKKWKLSIPLSELILIQWLCVLLGALKPLILSGRALHLSAAWFSLTVDTFIEMLRFMLFAALLLGIEWAILRPFAQRTPRPSSMTPSLIGTLDVFLGMLLFLLLALSAYFH